MLPPPLSPLQSPPLILLSLLLRRQSDHWRSGRKRRRGAWLPGLGRTQWIREASVERSSSWSSGVHLDPALGFDPFSVSDDLRPMRLVRAGSLPPRRPQGSFTFPGRQAPSSLKGSQWLLGHHRETTTRARQGLGQPVFLRRGLHASLLFPPAPHCRGQTELPRPRKSVQR